MSLSLLFLPLKDQDSPDLYYYARRLRAKSYFDWHRLGEIFNCSQPYQNAVRECIIMERLPATKIKQISANKYSPIYKKQNSSNKTTKEY